MAISKTQEEEVCKVIQQALGSILRRVWLTGSQARGTAVRSSDLDLLFDVGAPLPLHQLARTREAFEESALPWRVDLVDIHRIDAETAAHMLIGARQIFGVSHAN